LWDRIKPKTQYRIEFETDELVRRAVAAIKKMEKIEPAKIRVTTGQVGVVRGGVTATAISAAEEQMTFRNGPIPDVLAYLQNETELTRSTLVQILKKSVRLAEFFVDPQRFMDAVANILKYELHRLLVDGIKYEKIGGTGPEAEWEMLKFTENDGEELINYLTALQVNHSVYEYVVYESEVEKDFAKRLDEREDLRQASKLVRDRYPGRQIQPRLGHRQARRSDAVPGPRDQEHKGLPETADHRGGKGSLRAEAL
jgi:type III restriction enzyme